LEGTESEGPRILETLVPTPLFPGQVYVDGSNAISFAPATAEFATPVTHGTLMADFAADNRALRDSADVFPAKNFEKLVITWPGFLGEWKVPMGGIGEDADYISRAELANLATVQFKAFASTIGESACSDPEWKLGQGPDGYNTKNTCLVFLWNPAPGVWKPAFRVRGNPRDTKTEPPLGG